MTRKLQILRGTTAQNNAYTGAVGELTMDTDRNEVRIHDGQTVGGIKISDRNMPILTSMFFDHVVNDMSWLRADTFSWQSGDVYVAAYEHLADDAAGVEVLYAFRGSGNPTIGDNIAVDTVYAKTETVSVGSTVYLDTNMSVSSTITGVSGNTITSIASVSGYDFAFTDGYVRNSAYDYMSGFKTDTIGDITITYYTAEDGHKICLPDQESNIVALYEKTSAADYYLLDMTNKQFKLPREDKDGKYLYFYVGNFEQSAIEQTAGITAETLNNKADRDLSNLPTNYDYIVESQLPNADNGYTWYRKYKSGWVEQGGISSVTGYATTSNSNITLPVEMSDMNYTVVATMNSGGENVAVGNAVLKKSTAAISLRINFNSSLTRTMSWQVSGMSAQ